MANEKNLIPNEERTPSERRENARKAGIASGEARREKKLLRECLEELLAKEFIDEYGETKTGAEALAVKLFQKALSGDIKAFEVVRDTSGQKPVEKIAHAEIDPAVLEEVERMVNESSRRNQSSDT